MFAPTNEPGIGKIAKLAFPNNKKPIKVSEFKGPITLNSYWDGGSRDEYRLVNLETNEVWTMPTSHPFYDRRPDGTRMGNVALHELPPNVALVRGGIFCGKPATVHVMLRNENFVTMLPSKTVELSDLEKSALRIIKTMTSGYRKEEFRRCSLGEYGKTNPHIISLSNYGLLKIGGTGISITVDGRNYE